MARRLHKKTIGGDTMNLSETIRKFCVAHNIHEACLFCKNDCKSEHSAWTGCMPFDEFCKQYEKDIKMEFITHLIMGLTNGV